jgi:hypothetical protein
VANDYSVITVPVKTTAFIPRRPEEVGLDHLPRAKRLQCFDLETPVFVNIPDE